MRFERFLLAILLAAPLAGSLLTLGEDPLASTTQPSAPLLTAPTPRTVTDERQLRIVATAIPGPEVAAGAARGTITGVAVEPGGALDDGGVLFQVDGIDRVGFASAIPFYTAHRVRRIGRTRRAAPPARAGRRLS